MSIFSLVFETDGEPLPYYKWEDPTKEKGSDPIIITDGGLLNRAAASIADSIGAVCELGPIYCEIPPPMDTDVDNQLITNDYEPKRRYRVGMEIR